MRFWSDVISDIVVVFIVSMSLCGNILNEYIVYYSFVSIYYCGIIFYLSRRVVSRGLFKFDFLLGISYFGFLFC